MSSTPEIVPATNFAAVSPSDSVNIVPKARALYVGGAGNLVAVTNGGTAVTFVGVTAGSILPIQTIRVNSTNTTATSIVALF